ncbi:MAG: hypothetical protein LBQ60_02890 [Bacteroidales bacterium]|nr:hypothetical protein [Bacteroidales bacterium]
MAFKHLDIDYPKFYKMDRLCKLGFLAAEYLFYGDPECHPEESTAIILANSTGSHYSDMRHYETIRDPENIQPSPSVFVYTLPNIVIGEIAIRHGIKGENAFFICRDKEESTVQDYANTLLSNHITRSCLTGWVDYYHDTDYLAELFWIKA